MFVFFLKKKEKKRRWTERDGWRARKIIRSDLIGFSLSLSLVSSFNANDFDGNRRIPNRSFVLLRFFLSFFSFSFFFLVVVEAFDSKRRLTTV